MSANHPQATEQRLRHRRETVRQIALPFALGVGLIVICAVVVMFFRQRLQVAAVADLMFTVLILCPAVLCLLAISILMVAAVALTTRAHGLLAKPLARLSSITQSVSEQAATTTNKVNRTTLDLSARLGFLYRWSTFESRKKKEG